MNALDTPSPEPRLHDLLRARAADHGGKTAFRFLRDGEIEAERIGYAELQAAAAGLAHELRQRRPAGDRVLLFLPTGIDYVVAFFGCLLAGLVAVPLYPPRANRADPRVAAVIADSGATLALCSADARAETWACCSPEAAAPIEVLTMRVADWRRTGTGLQTASGGGNALAYLQYTSGSTGDPKGVMISHRNALANARQMQSAYALTDRDEFVSWLPLFHDMGLVGSVTVAVLVGATSTLLPPAAFLQRPLRWLRAISDVGGSFSGGPNFGYELCLERVTAAERDALRLQRWRIAVNSAEPVRAATLERFAAMFAPAGFRRDALFPSYGLAEATLLVGSRRDRRPVVRHFVTEALNAGVVTESGATPQTVALAGCGAAADTETIRIVAPDTGLPVEPGQVGEIWVAGASVSAGYWQNPRATAQTFGARLPDSDERFLRTGDLGFWHDRELFVAARLKDLIIIRGRNHAPQDIEHTVEQASSAVQAGGVIAFSVQEDQVEQLIVVAELKRIARHGVDLSEECAAIREAVLAEHEVRVERLQLIGPRKLPKTSSGKLQRGLCRRLFVDGALDPVLAWPPESAVPALPATVPETGSAAAREADALIGWLRRYAAERINSRIIDERRCIPPYIVLDFGNRGLLGLQVPRAQGGLELDDRSFLRVIEQLGAIDQTLALFVGLHNVLGVRPIQRHAAPALRERLLPLLAGGRELAAFALTEPGAGSDPSAMGATAQAVGPDAWSLRGEKIWSGAAAWAGAINVFARELAPDGTPLGFSAFVVRQGTPGLVQGPEALTTGVRGLVQNQVLLRDVRVTSADRLGAPGTGMAVAQDAMMQGRLAIAGAALGAMQRCAQLMLRYAQRRTVAGGLLIDNPVTRDRLERLGGAIGAARCLVYAAADLSEAPHAPLVELSAACKILVPEELWRAVDDLTQLLGGRGYIETNGIPQWMRDARVLRIFEGPTETLKSFLGALAGRQPERIARIVGDDLGAPALAERLRALLGAPAAAHDEPAWRQQSIADVVVHACTLAAVESARARLDDRDADATAEHDLAAAWAMRRLEGAERRLEMRGSAGRAPQDATRIARGIAAYERRIGNVDQAMAGEAHELDALLRPAAPAVASEVAPSDPWPAKPRMPPVTPPDAAQARSGLQRELSDWMRAWIAARNRVPANEVPADANFYRHGLDSVAAVEMAQALEDRFGAHPDASPTLMWEYPSVDALCAHLASTYPEGRGTPPNPAGRTAAAPPASLPARLADEIRAARELIEPQDAR
ncbi:MAG: AMP-binding protein [Proteobacteria bacterium]|nr:AMP-binding protein [Pseudomonadota bacterium]